MDSKSLRYYALILILVISIIPVIEVKAQIDHVFKDSGIYSAEVKIATGELILSAWNREVEISFQMPDIPITSTIQEEKLELEYDDFKVRVYEIEKSKLFEEGGIEYEVVLPTKPFSNKISFQMATKGLKFFYQPPLFEEHLSGTLPGVITCNATHGFDKNGELLVYRPINVVDSYAVYHESKKNNEYKTGKAYHIYRPKLIDGAGKEEWGKMNIESGVLTITMPQDYLDSAKYPVIIDPGFGYDTIGGTSIAIANNIRGSVFTCNDAGTADSITVAIRKIGSGGDIQDKCALYDTNGDLVTNGGGPEETNWITSSFQWFTFEFTGTDPIVAAQDYVIVAWGEQIPSHFIAYDAEAGKGRYDAETYNGWPDPASFSSEDKECSIYCNYTVVGGDSYVRDLIQAFSVGGSVVRTWGATRALTQSFSVAGNVYKKWDAKRFLTQAINLASNVEGMLTEAATFVRDLTQTITVGASVSAYLGITYIRAVSQAISYTINIDTSHIIGTGWSLLTVFVKTLDGVAIPTASVSVFVVGGSNVFSESTNATGYTSTYNVSNENYTVMASKTDYISSDTLFNLIHNTIIEVTLTHAEEAILLSFNIELLVLAAVSMIFMLMMLYTSQPGMGVISGTLAFFFWMSTGLYYMYSNIEDQYAIGYLFVGLGIICMIMTVYAGLKTLDPKRAKGDLIL